MSNVSKTEKAILQYFHSFDNIVFWLERGDFPYEQAGRQQNEAQAKEVDRVLRQILDEFGISYHVIKLQSDNTDLSEILQYL